MTLRLNILIFFFNLLLESLNGLTGPFFSPKLKQIIPKHSSFLNHMHVKSFNRKFNFQWSNNEKKNYCIEAEMILGK